MSISLTCAAVFVTRAGAAVGAAAAVDGAGAAVGAALVLDAGDGAAAVGLDAGDVFVFLGAGGGSGFTSAFSGATVSGALALPKFASLSSSYFACIICSNVFLIVVSW